MVSNHVSHAFAARLADRDVTVAEWSLMRTLFDKPPTSPSRLAEQMGLSRGAITKLADRLVAKLLMTRAADPHDGRAQTLALTAHGVALVPELATLADQNDAEFFACLPADERETLLRLLKKMTERGRMTEIPMA